MEKEYDTAGLTVGVVGLGMMGCSITACLLMAGHPVVAVAPVSGDLLTAGDRIRGHLDHSFKEGLTHTGSGALLERLKITEDYGLLEGCVLVIECTLEDLAIKRNVYRKIESVVGKDT